VLRFDAPAVGPTATRQVSGAELEYATPALEFCLSRIDLTEAYALQLEGPELLLCVEGQVGVQSASQAAAPEPYVRSLRKGQACFLPASTASVRLSGAARLFRARVNSAA